MNYLNTARATKIKNSKPEMPVILNNEFIYTFPPPPALLRYNKHTKTSHILSIHLDELEMCIHLLNHHQHQGKILIHYFQKIKIPKMWPTFLSLRMNNIVLVIGAVLQLIFRTYSSGIIDFKIPTKRKLSTAPPSNPWQPPFYSLFLLS